MSTAANFSIEASNSTVPEKKNMTISATAPSPCFKFTPSMSRKKLKKRRTP